MTELQPRAPLPFRPLPETLGFVAVAGLAALVVLGSLGASWRVLTWGVVLLCVALLLLGVVAARRFGSAEPVSEQGVTGPGLLHPVFIPWNEVVQVDDDRYGLIISAANRSARLDLVSAWVQGRPVFVYADTEAVVRFVLSHVPKHAMIEVTYFLPE